MKRQRVTLATVVRNILPLVACCALSLLVGLDLDTVEQQCTSLFGLVPPAPQSENVPEDEGDDEPVRLITFLTRTGHDQRFCFDLAAPTPGSGNLVRSFLPSLLATTPRAMRWGCEHARRNGVGAPLLC